VDDLNEQIDQAVSDLASAQPAQRRHQGHAKRQRVRAQFTGRFGRGVRFQFIEAGSARLCLGVSFVISTTGQE